MKKEIKFKKVYEMVSFDKGKEILIEVGLSELSNKSFIITHHKDDSGNISRFEILADLSKNRLKKLNSRILFYGPLVKRLPRKIAVILVSSIIGLGVMKFFKINLISFLAGIIAYEILEEIYIKKINASYVKNSDNNYKVIEKGSFFYRKLDIKDLN